jgi:hypothetical protein
MGSIKINVRDLETANFDKFCAITLEVVYGLARDPSEVEFVRSGGEDLDIEGHEDDRDYWKRGLDSTTEALAIRLGLGKPNLSADKIVESDIPGLAPLCRALSRHHGKTGKPGGYLHVVGTIPMLARNLALLPLQAPEIARRIVMAIASALAAPQPIDRLNRTVADDVDGFWTRANRQLSEAELQVSKLSNEVAAALASGSDAHGASRFALALAPDEKPKAEGILVRTANPNLMKHLWASLKPYHGLRVATAVVANPETGRVAVLTAGHEKLDILPVVAELKRRFPGIDLEANVQRGSFIWDPRSSKAKGPDAATVAAVLGECLAIPATPAPAPAKSGGTLKASLGDKLKHLR